ncbi:AraC family transcriptional regulator [Thalassotalea sp. 42_200_T64]|nr:AraC family transcriptional regulator [Thalassotalea sp. 42_200_T64]
MSITNINSTSLKILHQVDLQQIVAMYELVPGALFWIKDVNGKLLHCNQCFIEHVGMKTLPQVVGLGDYDFSPPHIAKQFAVDDKKVLVGEEVSSRLELNVTKGGSMAWFTTSKRPLYSKDGSIIGTYGISQHIEQTNVEPAGLSLLQKPVDYIRDNYANEFSIKQLAEHSHLSVSALERRFKKYLAKTPLQFINEVRLEQARRMLIETSEPISRVASHCGFSEHSYFSRQFVKFFKVLPSDFRKKAQNRAKTS